MFTLSENKQNLGLSFTWKWVSCTLGCSFVSLVVGGSTPFGTQGGCIRMLGRGGQALPSMDLSGTPALPSSWSSSRPRSAPGSPPTPAPPPGAPPARPQPWPPQGSRQLLHLLCYLPCFSPLGCHNKVPQTRALNSRNLFSTTLEAKNPKPRRWQAGFSLACRWLFSPCVHTRSSLCACLGPISSTRTPVIGLGSTPRIHCNLTISLKTLCLRQVTFYGSGARDSVYEERVGECITYHHLHLQAQEWWPELHNLSFEGCRPGHWELGIQLLTEALLLSIEAWRGHGA